MYVWMDFNNEPAVQCNCMDNRDQDESYFQNKQYTSINHSSVYLSVYASVAMDGLMPWLSLFGSMVTLLVQLSVL